MKSNINKNMDEMADRAFVELKCKELLKDIEYIEQKSGMVLAGDRMDLQHKPYKDCVGKMTKAQTEWFFLIGGEGFLKGTILS